MGQTLTHGIYLPDEGERNCYAGLAANWQLLDGAVGTVAEHTTALAGKAPLVHTHSKSDITDFPAYGTTAGTICEGNDSRLSDARTPVAHTHGKADITDLFNSANVWSGENTYTATLKYKTSYTLGNPPQSTDAQSAVMVTDSAGTNYLAQIATYQNIDTTGCRITIRDKFDANGFSPSGSNRNKHFYFLQTIANQGFLQWDGYANNSIYPLANNTYNLGTSSYKWKTLNGVNPGALSLPSGGTTENTDWYNVAGNILPTGGNATDFTGGQNFFTPSKDGWLALSVASCESVAAWVFSLKYGLSVVAPNAGDNQQLIIPVVAGKQVEIKVKGSRWLYARLIVTQGNV